MRKEFNLYDERDKTQKKESKHSVPHHMALPNKLLLPVAPSLASKTSRAEFSCR